jgi:hypothetical protein
MKFKPNDKVVLLRDINRISDTPSREEILYASKGALGLVVEMFLQASCGAGKRKTPYVKVKMNEDGKIKTFRATSLAQVD